jgi:peptidoglycan-N-acetylglucosamine deacetylase
VARSLDLPRWPHGADVAVCLTFDVDAEAPWLAQSPEYAGRLSTLSEGRYGVVRAVPRILDLLRRRQARATFYIPGTTAERYPDCVRSVVAAGHEVGHHGYLHLRSHEVGPETQRAEIERGLGALGRLLDHAPRGYRSPAWELTPETFALLLEHGFGWDSSCMGDDRPYLEELNGRPLLELPVHWSLDDWPYHGWSVERGGNMSSPSSWVQSWLAEFESARGERRLVTYTMHPEVVGRGYRFSALEELMEAMEDRGSVWFPSHGEVAGVLADHGALTARSS